MTCKQTRNQASKCGGSHSFFSTKKLWVEVDYRGATAPKHFSAVHFISWPGRKDEMKF